MPHRLVRIAKDSIRAHLRGESPPASSNEGVLPWGVFVSLHGPGVGGEEGPLRGCIGSLHLSEVDLEEEVGRVAVSSATTDPRFPALAAEEVDELHVTVYLLDPPQIVAGAEDLEPGKYGVIVTGRGGRRGLLLPDLPGIDTPDRQLELALLKAGLSPGSDVTIERFAAQAVS